MNANSRDPHTPSSYSTRPTHLSCAPLTILIFLICYGSYGSITLLYESRSSLRQYLCIDTPFIWITAFAFHPTLTCIVFLSSSVFLFPTHTFLTLFITTFAPFPPLSPRCQLLECNHQSGPPPSRQLPPPGLLASVPLIATFPSPALR